MERGGATAMGDINQLPEECLSHVISLTSSRDACVSSAVSSTFRSAADSDATWQRFLPPDCPAILSRAVSPVEFASKKELFVRLCDRAVLIDGGKLVISISPFLLELLFFSSNFSISISERQAVT
jgi:F-box domain